MKKLVLSFAFLLLCAHAYGIVPLWLRDVQISPDGSQIVFCYKGDIYKVAAQGGTAVQLTTQSSYECNPVWSPDGTQIAFASDRNGNLDIFVMAADGGAARRLTTNSAAETPWGFTPDGKDILFSASIQDPAQSAFFPSTRMAELYKVPAIGGRTRQVLGTPAEMTVFTPDGKYMLYQDQKGFEDQWRKHQASSVTRDIWQYDLQTGKHTNLTDCIGEDRNPVLSADGQTVYFLSERDGQSFNVYSFNRSNPKSAKQLTRFNLHPVRFLSVASNGVLCFAYDGEIYTMQGDAGTPKKVSVSLTRDDENLPADLKSANGARYASVSPDGKQVAFAYRGEVFVTSVEYGTTKQITHTAANEREVSFGPDNRTLVYTSERDGYWNIYQATIGRTADPNFPNATVVEEKALFPADGIERTAPDFSPNGKELAYIEGRHRLMVMDMATGRTRQVTDGSKWPETSGAFSFDWSPDGKWFTLEFIGNKRDPYADIGLVSAQGGEITNLTNSGYINQSPQFVMDGNAILFLSNRYGMRSHASWGSQDDAMLVFLNQDAYDKYRLSKEDYELKKELEKDQKKADDKKASPKDDKKGKDGGKKDQEEQVKDIVVELDGIEDRIERVTPVSASMSGALIDKEGETLYYFAAFENGSALWKVNLREKSLAMASKTTGGSLQMDKEGKNIFILGGRMQKMDAKSGKLTPISYNAEMKMDLAAERDYMFQRVYQQVKQRLFDPAIASADWEVMTAAYKKFMPHIANNYDFQELLSEWLGELNVSHSGGRYSPQLGGKTTATLGLLYDMAYTGKGLKIDEVVEKGPFDHAQSKVVVGTLIEKIDGVEISEETDYNTLLNGKERHKTLVSLFNPQTGERWEEVVLPISQSAHNSLLYKRWVKQRAADVEKWSDGRLGYVHIESMNDGSYRTIYSDILGKYNQKEGIVIDTRFNGGGRLHEDIQILFSGSKYFTQVVRGVEACDMPSRRWNKPSIMVQCEANYSNAHGTPWVYQHEKIGKLVGMPVPGTMSSVMWETLQDPTLVFGVPVVGYRLPDGTYLENSELNPDVKVANSPETIVQGIDSQLKTAVEVLLKDIDSAK